MNTNFFAKKASATLLALLLVSAMILLSACSDPSPLVGTWTDNRGDQITLMADGAFSATITDSVGNTSRSEGSYTVLLNAISFTATTGHQIVSEWDIRGNMLYLNWTDSYGNTISLTLYKTRN